MLWQARATPARAALSQTFPHERHPARYFSRLHAGYRSERVYAYIASFD
ncbi:hypothetical protein C7S14_8437 [Burkholderia cepacia]|nr:hypothetical protein C7S14_8437 [Burkholderia cepacia]